MILYVKKIKLYLKKIKRKREGLKKFKNTQKQFFEFLLDYFASYFSFLFFFNLSRTKNYIQRYFGTNNVNCSKEDGKSIPTQEISKETESQNSVKENSKKDLLNIIKDMKVEISTINVQTTKPPNRRPLKNLEATTGRLKKATKDAPQKR